jgi:CO/xanthine dehydrogenase Mo-binding subunit
LCESAQLSPQGIASNNWDNYPILKFSDMPAVEVAFMSQPHEPSLGAGECSSGPTCAAIANAIFDAIGVRMRAMPFTPDNLLKTIEADHTSAQS